MAPWDRTKLAWQHAFFAVTLALAGAGALAGHGAGGIALRAGLLAMLAGWYAFWFVWRRNSDLAYLIGAAVLWAAMSAVDPSLFAVGVAVLIPYCLRHPVWAAITFGALVATWIATRGIPSVAALIACALGLVAAVTVLGYIATLDREGRRRQGLLDELAAAQAELAAAERRAGILAERQRLARDIHDTLTQGFASIALHLDAASDDLPPGGPAMRNIDQARRTARDNLVESRRLIAALRPLGLSLPDALRRLTGRISEDADLAAHSVVTGHPIPLGDAVESEVLRAVQEALTNVRRHAQATEVTVTLSYAVDLVLVDIQDNGRGLDGPRSTGYGLVGMRERLDGIGGTLTVETAPGEGTTIAMTVPVTPR